MAMFGRFTEKAQKSILLAQEMAQEFKHNYVGTEHLLLGLLKEGDGIAAKALINMNVSVDKLKEKIIEVVGDGQ